VCWCETNGIVIQKAENVTAVIVSPSCILLFLFQANFPLLRAHATVVLLNSLFTIPSCTYSYTPYFAATAGPFSTEFALL
jgi:hypothetical protein